MAVGGTLTYKTELDTAGYQKGINGIVSKTKSAGSSVKSIVAGLGITKLISSAMNTIRNSVDGAINRIDTLDNFPRVMSNLGISSDKAEKSIKKMSDKLAGLPTTLDQGASAVQRFTSANNDVERSTDIFLALNNAIIAGGAPTEQQAMAMEQLSQAYAKGKPDMIEWKSAMTAMPAQLQQVAKAMGYVSADELGEALRTGKVSMDEFMDAIVKLNTEGSNGFESFEKQAKNSTAGIKTSITVAKTQVVKGVADIIKALDIKLESLGIGKISDVIAEVGKKAKEELDKIAGLIKGNTTLKEFTDSALENINDFLKKINEYIPIVIEKGADIINELLNSLIENSESLVSTGAEMIEKIAIGLSEAMPTLIPVVVRLLLEIVNGIIDNLDKIVDAGIQLMYKLAEGIEKSIPSVVDKMPALIEKLLLAIADALPKFMEMGVMLNIKIGLGILKSIPSVVAHIPALINALLNGITTFFGKFIETGANIVIKIADGMTGGVLGRIIKAGIDVLASFVNGLDSKLEDLNEAAKKIPKAVINAVKNLASKMIEYGKDAINGFVKGITSTVGKVGDAAKGIANKVKNFLHFSRPDEGPLREYEKWMPDMVKGLADSMKRSSSIIEKQSKNLAEKIKEQLDIDYLDDVYKKLETAVNIQTGKMSFSGTNGTINQILTASGTTTVVNENKLLLDGDVIYENQNKVKARKKLQTQFGGAYYVST